ncbi:odorant receptor 49b-like isoform X1 [Hylaeus anthracinus]|uniref:odorant receptor 49b-like isoform X1 n=2 Tax=Hylaeus anthracinus TaxID=313031 RepID=UPI0023B93E5E|nr:odorant receptor 49b-like isoform X1 [Hylaeus anthracinus]
MNFLQCIYALQRAIGAAPSSTWTSSTQKSLYNVYTMFLFFLVHSHLISQVMDIVYVVENQDDFCENFYLTMGVFASCCKLCYMLSSRDNYDVLIKTMQSEPLGPANDDEVKIQSKYEKWAKRNLMIYVTLIEGCYVLILINSLAREFMQRKLVIRIFIPYNFYPTTSLPKFTVVYIYQFLVMTFCLLMNITCDNLFGGLLIHNYSAFDILAYRMSNVIKYGNHSAKQCARLHDHIYKFATMINEEFKIITLLQYLLSTILCCLNLYRITNNEDPSKVYEIMLFSFNTYLHILFFCWYGNEVREKSLQMAEVVGETDWTSLDNDSKMIFLMIMKRATTPIEFSTANLVSINLESFKTIVKSSYSAFNVLRR